VQAKQNSWFFKHTHILIPWFHICCTQYVIKCIHYTAEE
jgi:hypothetical protein